MRKIAIGIALGAAAWLGGTAANASDTSARAKPSIEGTSQSTDFSAHRRYYRQRYYRSYGYYAPRRTYYAPQYYAPAPYYGSGYGYGGPSISFGFGGGGYGGHHHHGGHW